MKTLVMCKGLPGCGKTTWAKQQQAENPGKYKVVNKDSLRLMLDDSIWSKANEKFVVASRNRLISTALEAGWSVICDDTNLNPVHERELQKLAAAGGADFQVQDFTDVDLQTCIERDLRRLSSVGNRVIEKMYYQYLYVPPPPAARVDGLPSAIIVDLDGTLAINTSGRSWYDTKGACERDELCIPVAQVLRTYLEAGCGNVIIISGREGVVRAPTERWLAAKQIKYTHLFMRAANDTRPDHIIKREIYDAHISGRYNVDFVIDDRLQVIRQCWRPLGLFVLNVNQDLINF